MNRFDFTNKLNFEEVDLTPPDKVIRTLGEEFKKATRNIVHMGLAKYDGKITQAQPSFATTISGMFQKASGADSIQPELGKVGGTIHQYELFLYTPSYTDYRFRLMFIRFGIANYPAEIILEQGVAEACNFVSGYGDPVIHADSKHKLEELVTKVLTSDYTVTVMQELIRIDQLQRSKKKKSY